MTRLTTPNTDVGEIMPAWHLMAHSFEFENILFYLEREVLASWGQREVQIKHRHTSHQLCVVS